MTIVDQGGSSAAVSSTATVADQSLSGAGVTVTPAAEGDSTTLTASFSDANTSDSSDAYMAQIDWGDGQVDDAPVSGSGGSYTLTGSHVYDNPGTYPINVTVTDAGGATLTQTGSATVGEAALSVSGNSLYATAGQDTGTVVVGSFTDANTDQAVDGFGPATGYTATIDWGDGSGLDGNTTIVGDESGFYVQGDHTYAAAGTYTPTITVTGADGYSATGTSTVVVSTMAPADPAFSASEGIPANDVTVATFTDTRNGSYTAAIDWGDGTTDNGTVTGSGGNYSVTGSHTYADGGTYPVNVTITDDVGMTTVATATATVSDAALSATPQTLSTPQGSALNNATLATFTDANPNDSIDSYAASIDWGDGSPTDLGTITLTNGVYTVSGSHTYQTQGTFTATVYIGDAGGSTTTAASTVTVTAPVISATGTTLSAQVGVPLNDVTVATFTGNGQAGDYSATIDWGDGTTDNGTIAGSGGGLSVTGSHTYTEATGGQQFLVTVTVADSSGNTATALSGAAVDGGTFTAAGTSPQATEGIANNFTLAALTDTDPSYSADDYSAVVDWGDGNQDAATVTGSNGTFSVIDTHTYTEEGSYTAVVTIAGPDGSTQTVSDAVTVVDAALTATQGGGYLEPGPNVPLNGVTMAQFTDPNPYALASDFSATIDWGDGSSTAGVISGGNGVFSVIGSHTYGIQHYYNVTVTITDVGGSQAIVQEVQGVVKVAPVTVATFMDQNLNDQASDFSATIDWGDGTAPTGGTVDGGGGYFTVTGMHTYSEENPDYTVQVTITGPSGSVTAQSTAQVFESLLVAAAAPPAPPPEEKPQAVVPAVKLDFGRTLNPIAAAQPGLRIHLDDDFYVRMKDPLNPILQMADYRQSTVLPTLDSNLVEGTITIGPANSTGTLTWSIPNSVRVWWQPVQGGPWSLVGPGGPPRKDFNATGKPIPIVIQGMAPDGGPAANVSVEYTVSNNGNLATSSASFFYNVYTGLSVNGAAAPQQALVQLMEQASGYRLATDNSGKVWRTSKSTILTSGQVYIVSVVSGECEL